MSRRTATIVLAGFYLLQSTWMLHAGMDLLFPRVRTTATTPESCCANDCGCPAESKAARECCCVKHSQARHEARDAKPLSSIEEAKCKGVQDALSQALTQPAVCSFARVGAPVVESSVLSFASTQPLLSVDADSLEKVPIAQA